MWLLYFWFSWIVFVLGLVLSVLLGASFPFNTYAWGIRISLPYSSLSLSLSLSPPPVPPIDILSVHYCSVGYQALGKIWSSVCSCAADGACSFTHYTGMCFTNSSKHYYYWRRGLSQIWLFYLAVGQSGGWWNQYKLHPYWSCGYNLVIGSPLHAIFFFCQIDLSKIKINVWYSFVTRET